MLEYFLKRMLHMLFVLLGLATIVFILTYLSGDPTDLMLPPEASIAQREAFRQEMGFDRPILVQYFDFIFNAARMEFGNSFHHGQPAMEMVVSRIPATLQLSVVGMGLALLIGVPLGIFSALKRGSLFDSAASIIALFGQSFPVFWIGIMLILIFSEYMNLLPTSGRGTWQHLVLPGVTVSFMSMAMITRILRSSLLEVLGKNYITTARAKGLLERVVIYKHALRNASISMVTVIGLSIGLLFGGAIITETVFAWPGMGRLAIQAINNRDFTVVRAFVMFLGVTIAIINIFVDFVYRLLDPRIKID